MTRARAPRADAVRNRKKILDAAREQISLHGAEIGMDEIAAAAGVAVGTLYRHFPNKTDLVAAAAAEHIEGLTAEAEAAAQRVASGARAVDEITSFIEYVVEACAADHAVNVAALSLGAGSQDKATMQRATSAVAALVQAGQADGDINPDVTAADMFLLFSTAPADRPAAIRARWVALVLSGLLTHGRSLDS